MALVERSLGYDTRFGRGFISGVFAVALSALVLALAALATLLVDVLIDGWSRVNWQFLTSGVSRRLRAWAERTVRWRGLQVALYALGILTAFSLLSLP